MTKLLVLSDSHGGRAAIERVLMKESKSIDALIFLGDGLRDLELALTLCPKLRAYSVAGNCDYGALEPTDGLAAFDGVVIFYTHGHMYGVKYDLDTLADAASARGAEVALFGHTHIPHAETRSGVFLFSNMSLIFMAVIIGCSLFMRETGMVGIFAFATYMQLFTVALGRFNRELIKPYIYLIPEPPLKKLLYAIKESLLTDALEAVVLFLILGVIVGASPVETVCCMVARVSFALLFTAGNVCVERVFGMVRSKTLIFLFYFLVLLLMAIPGIVAAVVCAIWVPAWEVAAGLLAMTVVNAAIAVLVLWLCRNLLQYAELNSR